MRHNYIFEHLFVLHKIGGVFIPFQLSEQDVDLKEEENTRETRIEWSCQVECESGGALSVGGQSGALLEVENNLLLFTSFPPTRPEF